MGALKESMNMDTPVELASCSKETLIALVRHAETREQANTAINNELVRRLDGKLSDELADIVNEWSRVHIDKNEASARKTDEILTADKGSKLH